MRISLIGYGKMGKTIEQIALNRGHKIAHIIDADNASDVKLIKPENTDVAIEFTSPDAAYELIAQTVSNGVPVLSGTTGWLDRLSDIISLCNAKQGAFFYASNYSIGANIFFQLNQSLARMMKHQDYKVSIEETHHTEKKDAPSGTAITLAEGIIAEIEALTSWVNKEASHANEIPIDSKRLPGVPGTHIVSYTSENDFIEIKHEAKSRAGFASGAVMVAEWLADKEGIFTMKDFLSSQ